MTDFSDETPIALFVLMDNGSLDALIDNPMKLHEDEEGLYFANAVRRGIRQLEFARSGGTNLPMRFIPWHRTQEYLDDAIIKWRRIRDGKEDCTQIQIGMAPMYIDAFQSVRVSLLGELLPE